jgi:hypothetical protein
MTLATITLGIDPTIQVAPLQLAWRGIITAIGLAIASRSDSRIARVPREVTPPAAGAIPMSFCGWP